MSKATLLRNFRIDLHELIGQADFGIGVLNTDLETLIFHGAGVYTPRGISDSGLADDEICTLLDHRLISGWCADIASSYLLAKDEQQ